MAREVPGPGNIHYWSPAASYAIAESAAEEMDSRPNHDTPNADSRLHGHPERRSINSGLFVLEFNGIDVKQPKIVFSLIRSTADFHFTMPYEKVWKDNRAA